MSRSLLGIAVTLCLAFTRLSYGQGFDRPPAKAEQTDRVPDVLFIPTPHDIVARMLELAAVKQGDVVYDLGCGDGRVVVAAAKTYGCRAVGIDIDPIRVKQSQENVKRSDLEHLVVIKHQESLQGRSPPGERDYALSERFLQ